ncbi:MAG: YdeI/OmpD-associated family protein [Bacteroidetes bacterium]|nr:YdeI/OmpD-associated family protein [Bacteroidota bacterium]
MNPKVDFFFRKPGPWQTEFIELRKIALDCHLVEELKWGCPCYTFQNKNVILLHGFKKYCALLFFKGALLNDSKKILVQQTQNVQAARQMRFTQLSEILRQKNTIKKYIYEAAAAEEKGLKIVLKKTTEYSLSEEFQAKLSQMPRLKKAFYALTPGRQRGYLLFFSKGKQSKTREARIEKYIPHILSGKGLND